MSRYDTVDDRALWAVLLEIQKKLEEDFRRAAKVRKLSALGVMVAPLRRMHWAAAFLGLTDMADLAAAGAAFIRQLQEDRFRWSVELGTAVKTLIKRSRAFVDARPDEPSAGVFIDSGEAVLPGPELARPVPVDDLIALFRRRQIDTNVVSACRHISVGPDATFSHSITVPKFAKIRHKNDRHLTLVYLDLEEQETGFEGLTETFEDAFSRSEILLHGPLGIPWKNYRTYKAKRPYYLLLDTAPETGEWLRGHGIDARPVKKIREPADDVSAAGEAKVIIREVPAAPIYRPAPGPAPYRVSEPSAMAFDSAGVGELEPVKGRSAKPKKRRRIRNNDLGIRFPVGVKLILIVSAIIILGMSALTYTALFFFQRETRNRVEDTNISLSQIVAGQAEKEVIQLFDSANLLFQVGSASGGSATLVDDFFANSRSLVYVGIPGSGYDFTNRDWFRANRVFDETAVLQNILAVRGTDLERAKAGETVIINVSPLIPNLETPVIAMAAPFLLGTEPQALVVLADVGASLAESVRIQEGFTTTVIINSNGEMLAHPDFSRIFGGDSLKDSPVFEEMYTPGLPEGQVRFTEETLNGPVSAIGSFALIPVGNLGVVTTVLEKDAFQILGWIQRLNLYLLGGVLSLAILGVFLYSQSLSKPLKELTLATRQIKAGNYAISMKPQSADEVGQLTRNFLSMIPELEKVDRMRERISQFVSRQVAQHIEDDTLPEDARTKDVTVFFSDVRGFTSMSEKMGDPQLVMDNLSEYFQAMVPCVDETRGTVDKFIGDAVMAVWGSWQDLENNENAGKNAENAINGALMMRAALQDFNIGRGGTDRPFFQIGCGLNSGPATVGLMGGKAAKREWAHMGDTVNLASRIEQLNKPMGTDILISQATADRVEGIFDLVPMNKIRVKGKNEPQQIYAVLGRRDDESRPRSLDEMRALVGIDMKPGEVADAEEHEVKYEILDS